jgi:putative addiction module antidote
MLLHMVLQMLKQDSRRGGANMTTLNVQKIGNSLGVVLPKEITAKLNVDKGDKIFLIQTPSGFQITAYDPEFEEQVSLAEKVMKKRRNMLRKLAE